jgi:hypothetical protein
MVEYIEHLRTKLQHDGFVKWELSVYRKIPLGAAEASEVIPAEVSLA